MIAITLVCHTATHCNTLQHTAPHCNTEMFVQVAYMYTSWWSQSLWATTLQHGFFFDHTTVTRIFTTLQHGFVSMPIVLEPRRPAHKRTSVKKAGWIPPRVPQFYFLVVGSSSTWLGVLVTKVGFLRKNGKNGTNGSMTERKLECWMHIYATYIGVPIFDYRYV